MPNTIGLKQRIREATSKMEVGALMMEGEKYEYASGHTRHQWRRIAKEKIREFNQETVDVKKKSNS